ncbi:hypothetical protein WT33_20625 [Burkholderia stagnalis]|nr:hypothetical protein WT33_20625 [Burkholderia stagnalis]
MFLLQTPDRIMCAQHPGVVGMLVIDYKAMSRADIAEVARTLATLYDVKYAVSLTEYGSLPAAWINEALGTPGVSVRAVELTRNKTAMRQATDSVDPHPWAVARCVGDIIAFGRAVGWPVIIKPSDGAGSVRVYRADSETDVPDVDWSAGAYILEKYLIGRLISVEAFSVAGQHTLYVFNEEFPIGQNGPIGCNPYVETAHEMPARLTTKEVREIGDLVKKVLSALDILEGASHTEILLTDTGPHLLESHTRWGGDYIPDRFMRCTGIDLVELSIGAPAGLLAPPQPAEFKRGAGMLYFTPPPGQLKSVTGAEICSNLPGVVMAKLNIEPGANISKLLSSSERVGFVMAVADDAYTASEICRNAVSRVHLQVQEQSGN